MNEQLKHHEKKKRDEEGICHFNIGIIFACENVP